MPALFVAAYLLSVPNAVQCVFSTAGRVSQMFLELVYRFFIAFPGAEKMVIKYTTETLWIQGDHPGDIRKVFSYPSNEKIWSICKSFFKFSIFAFYSSFRLGEPRALLIFLQVASLWRQQTL